MDTMDTIPTVREVWNRHEKVYEFDTINEATGFFEKAKRDLIPGHILYLDTGSMIARYPPRSEKETFRRAAQPGGTGGAIKVTIPAVVRDKMDIRAGDNLIVTIQRDDDPNQ